MYLGLTLQLGGIPAYTLASIIGSYRAQLKFSGGRQRGNLWGMVAWIVSAPPVLALIALPYIFWKPALIVTLPLGLVYSVGLYGLTLAPLARFLQRREHAILQAISSD
jgi:ABC-type amino acid transport system permease subunit